MPAACRARLTVAAQRRIGPGRRALLAAQGGGQCESTKSHVCTQGYPKLLRLRMEDQKVTVDDDFMRWQRCPRGRSAGHAWKQ